MKMGLITCDYDHVRKVEKYPDCVDFETYLTGTLRKRNVKSRI